MEIPWVLRFGQISIYQGISLPSDCCQKATKGHYLISHPHIECHRAKHAMDTALFVQNTNVHIVLPEGVFCVKI